MRRTVQSLFIDPSPTNAFPGRVSAPLGPQLQPATTREAELVVCDQSIYHYFRAWRLDDTWEEIHTVLRGVLRRRSGREESPGAGIVDSQSARTTEQGGPRGYDGAKKVNGRKRHLLVDSTGLVLSAKAHPADLADRDGARVLLEGACESFPRLSLLWADAGYRGAALREWVTGALGLTLEIVQRRRRWRWVPPGGEPPPLPVGFEVIKRRWVVERTFAWICRNRRMSRDYERLGQTTEALPFQPVGYGYRFAYELGASLERVEGAKHFVPEDHPEPVAAAVNALLEDLGR